MLVIGVMSGTSLDGIDLALCEFNGRNPVSYKILLAKTYEYEDDWKKELAQMHTRDGLYLSSMNIHYGRYIAFQILRFIECDDFASVVKGYAHEDLQNILVSSHGHTIFHEPDTGLTFQLGHGAVIMALTGLHVISDFRIQDVALGGQGAPLVPIGDELLFGEYKACLNIGGFANVSLKEDDVRKAWDICPVNFVLNRWAERLGDTMDRDGMYSSKGKMLYDILHQWENLEFYKKLPPKSLGREWVEPVFLNPLYEPAFDAKDLMCTALEHMSRRIAHALPEDGPVLVTGGGAYHPTLLQKIRKLSKAEIVVPDSTLIDYKEALIFALMGYLRWQNIPNVLGSVTGARTDHSSGVVYQAC